MTTTAHPLVFLPGLLCDRDVWTAQLATLAQHAECRVADYASLDSLPAMAQAVLEATPGELAVVGHSMGGRVALEVYRQAPDRVRALALLDTGYQARPADSAGEREHAERMQLVEVARQDGMRAMGAQWVRRMVHPDRLADAALVEAILAMIERKTPAIFDAQQRALLARPDATQLLSGIACPTLVLCGREDAWSPLSRHEEMARLIPHSELVVVERSGHMVTMERPGEVSDALAAWLTSSVARSRR